MIIASIYLLLNLALAVEPRETGFKDLPASPPALTSPARPGLKARARFPQDDEHNALIEAPLPTEDPFPAATPESEGVPQPALDRLTELVTGFVEAEEIVGAELLIIKNRRTILHELFGHDDPNRDQPLKQDTIFSIRSIT